MMSAHQNGLAVIGQFDYERAEFITTSLQAQGLSVDMIKVGDGEGIPM